MTLSQNWIHVYRPTALIKVTGEDAAGFLQGQFTNDLRQATGSVSYGLWLNQKGKIVADSQVLRRGDNEFLVVSLTSPAATIQQRLEEYIVADDVVVEDQTPTAQGLAVGGAGGEVLIKARFGPVPLPGQYGGNGLGLVFPGRRERAGSYEIFGPQNELAEFRTRLIAQGAVEQSADEMEGRRIEAGIPAVPPDLGSGDLPNEGGLDETAVSYTKGCYLGQEVMARLKNLGRVRRRLQVVQGTGAPPPFLAPLYQGEKKVGEIRSAAVRASGFVAWAMLSLINLDLAAGFSLVPNGPVDARIRSHE